MDQKGKSKNTKNNLPSKNKNQIDKKAENSTSKTFSNQLKVWEAFIKANEELIKAKSIPFEVGKIINVKYSKNKWNQPVIISKISAIQPDIETLLLRTLVSKGVVPNPHHIELENGFLRTSHVDSKGRKILKNVFKDLYNKHPKVLECDPRPVKWGKMISLKDNYKNLTENIGISQKIEEEETIYCTIEEIRKIDIYSRSHKYIKREPHIAAVLQIYRYNDEVIIEKKLNQFSEFLISKINVYRKYNRVSDQSNNKYPERKIRALNLEVINAKGDTDYLEEKLVEFGFYRDNWKGIFECVNSDGEKVIEEKATQQVSNALYIHLLRLRTKYLSVKLININGSFQSEDFEFSIKKMKENALAFLIEEGYNISASNRDKETISFDVKNKIELADNLQKLETLNLISHNYHSIGEDFRYKVRLIIENPDLVYLAKILKQKFNDNIDFEMSENGYILNFKYFSESNNFSEFENQIYEIEEQYAVKIDFEESLHSNSYYFKINKEVQKSLFNDRINQLFGAEFFWVKPLKNENSRNSNRSVSFGQIDIKKSNFSTLIFNLTLDTNESVIYSEEIKSLFESEENLKFVVPDLSGDLSKNDYLKDAIRKIIYPTSRFYGQNPVNKNIGEFIFDSSKATPVAENLIEKERREVKKWLHSKNINGSQIDSVVKAILAEDLALLQGPPGSGKTTVIAEMIWQLLRKKQDSKILLTSESNLAVDNALSRLLNRKNMIVKPIRFGRNVQEEEGKQFQLERINLWAENIEDLNPEDNENAVQFWLNSIRNRFESKKHIEMPYEKKWKNELKSPSIFTRKLFRSSYLKNINVIGNTCSSSGSPNFVFNYQEIFHPPLDRKIKSKYLYNYKENGAVSKVDVANLPPVKFDTVIMDEASKATPPELLLPLTFGQKSIIIGDHRQLPPSLNEEDFIETLEAIGKQDLAKNWTKKDYKTSQFERLFLNPKISTTIKGTFNKQFRMHPQINEVIKQFYLEDGGLECGLPLDQVNIPDLNNISSRFHGFSHKGFISPDNHAIWINVNEPELSDGTSKVNEAEVEAIRRVLKYLQNAQGFLDYMNHWKDMEQKEIGIISFYGKQMNRLKVLNKEFSKLDLLMKTVDRFQGMERNIIIVSTVRSNKTIDTPHQKPSLIKFPDNNGYRRNHSLGFAETPQRLNVALSRAKRLLIVVGNADHFGKNTMYRNVIDTIKGFGKSEPSFIDFKELNKYN